MPSSRVALLCIDLQQGFVNGRTSLYRKDDLLRVVGDLQARARDCGVTLVHARFDGGHGHPTEVHSHGWQFIESVQPQAGELVVGKRSCDSFHQSLLQEELQARDIKTLYIVGCVTELCIDSTARTAAALGYDVVIVSDGHSTPDATAEDCPTPAMRVNWFNHVMRKLCDDIYRISVVEAKTACHIWANAANLALPSSAE